jgi:CheY-like chemotaxis protein
MVPPRPTVLLVEDSDLFRAMLRVYLKDLPVDVVEANDGDTALVVLATRDVALVVADLNMSRVGGLELLEAMRCHARPAVRDAAFVLMTAEEPSSPHFAEARAARVDAFVTKPVRPKVFRDTVLALTSR